MKVRAYVLIMIGAVILPVAIFAAVALQTLLRAERGKGSTFRLCLPLLAEAENEAAYAPAPETAGARLPSSVLLVDDNEVGRRMLAAQLAARGYRVLEAGDGTEGLALARGERPDLAILDIGLPGMDGYQLARSLRQDPALRGMRLFALTGYGQEADRQRAFDAGFDAHFVKPLDFEDLAARMAAA